MLLLAAGTTALSAPVRAGGPVLVGAFGLIRLGLGLGGLAAALAACATPAMPNRWAARQRHVDIEGATW